MKERTASLKIGKKAFLLAFFIILGLMIVSGILTKVVQPGEFERVSVNGREQVVPGSFEFRQPPEYPVWRWFTAPVEVLYSEGNLPVITIILFLIFVGGSFTILELGGVIESLLNLMVRKFGTRKYLLMGILIFFFMFLAAFLGIYETLIPLVVLIVPLAHAMGWDSMTGLGMSLLPLAFGFSAAVTNPFTIGVAQTIAELPLFSGAWLRLIFFTVIFFLVYLYVRRYAKKIERKPESSPVYREDIPVKESLARSTHTAQVDEGLPKYMKRALTWFGACMGAAIVFVLVTSQIPALSDAAFPVMALLFLIGGIGSGLLAKMGGKGVLKAFSRGTINMLPGVILIMMSMSVKHIVDQGMITDTILYRAGTIIGGASPFSAALLIYLLTLIMNFFIGSASAKAFLMMPILVPLADLVGITRQTSVLAFDMGDGFSNMLYPSNAILIIALGLTVVSYPKWVKWSIPLQALIFAISIGFIGIAVAVNFGPF
ncbi:MAG: YfcC family protein [Spirochaetia bacterium]